jgi:hypothetical protein
MTERERAARRRLVWLLLTRGDVGGEPLRSDGLPALRPPPPPPEPNLARHRGGQEPAPAGDMTRPA